MTYKWGWLLSPLNKVLGSHPPSKETFPRIDPEKLDLLLVPAVALDLKRQGWWKNARGGLKRRGVGWIFFPAEITSCQRGEWWCYFLGGIILGRFFLFWGGNIWGSAASFF